MRFLLIAALLTVAAAVPAHRDLVIPIAAGPAPVIFPEPDTIESEVIGSPAVITPIAVEEPDNEPISVGPAIVEEPDYEPISVGPAIVEEPVFEPISVGPAILDFPLPDGGAVTAPVAPSPVVIGQLPPNVNALVQIILNIKNADPSVIPVGVVVPKPPVRPEPVQVVESAPVQEVEATPVQVIETAPVPVEPVIIGTPIIPAPAVVLPEELN